MEKVAEDQQFSSTHEDEEHGEEEQRVEEHGEEEHGDADVISVETWSMASGTEGASLSDLEAEAEAEAGAGAETEEEEEEEEETDAYARIEAQYPHINAVRMESSQGKQGLQLTSSVTLDSTSRNGMPTGVRYSQSLEQKKSGPEKGNSGTPQRWVWVCNRQDQDAGSASSEDLTSDSDGEQHYHHQSGNTSNSSSSSSEDEGMALPLNTRIGGKYASMSTWRGAAGQNPRITLHRANVVSGNGTMSRIEARLKNGQLVGRRKLRRWENDRFVRLSAAGASANASANASASASSSSPFDGSGIADLQNNSVPLFLELQKRELLDAFADCEIGRFIIGTPMAEEDSGKTKHSRSKRKKKGHKLVQLGNRKELLGMQSEARNRMFFKNMSKKLRTHALKMSGRESSLEFIASIEKILLVAFPIAGSAFEPEAASLKAAFEAVEDFLHSPPQIVTVRRSNATHNKATVEYVSIQAKSSYGRIMIHALADFHGLSSKSVSRTSANSNAGTQGNPSPSPSSSSSSSNVVDLSDADQTSIDNDSDQILDDTQMAPRQPHEKRLGFSGSNNANNGNGSEEALRLTLIRNPNGVSLADDYVLKNQRKLALHSSLADYLVAR